MFPFSRNRRVAGVVTALGLGADGVSLAQVRRESGKPPVLARCDHRAVPGAEGWPGALAELRRAHRLERMPCSLLLEQEAYALLLVESPDVPPDELRAAVRWRIQDLIDFPVDDAVIDVFHLPAQRSAGRPRMVYVVAARLDAVRERAALVQESGLNLEIIDIGELALRNVAAELPEDASGVALLRVGLERGLITLSKQGTLYLARRLDRGSGSLVAAGSDARADDPQVSAWIDGLLVEVQRSLDYYESNFEQAPIAHLVVAPMEVEIAGLEGYMATHLGVDVRRLALPELIDRDPDVSLDGAARCLPVIGAALRHEAAAA